MERTERFLEQTCFRPSQDFLKVKVKQSHYRPEQAQRVGRGIAVLFRDLGARRGWVVNLTPRPLYPPESPGTHCTGGWVGLRAGVDVCEKSRPHRYSIPGPSSQSLYRLSYPTHGFFEESSNYGDFLVPASTYVCFCHMPRALRFHFL
jgi:hypothetical protein